MATIHSVQTPGGWAHPPARQDDGSSRFGEWLMQVRTARGLTLDDISRETKIPMRNLEALEHGDLGVVPVFYQRAEVRAIARVVGVDEGMAIKRLNTAITPAEEPPADHAEGHEDHEDKVRPWSKPISAPAFVVVVFGVLLAATGIGRAVLGWTAPPQQSGNAVAAARASVATPSDAGVRVASAMPVGQPEPVIPASSSVQIDAGGLLASQQPAAREAETAVPVAPTPSFTEIVVRTEPPGARVTVNGISWGASPVTIRHLPPGAKRIRATKEGFAATEQVFALGDGQRETLNLRLSGAE